MVILVVNDSYLVHPFAALSMEIVTTHTLFESFSIFVLAFHAQA